MRYMLLIYGDPAHYAGLDQAAVEADMAAYWEFTKAITDSGELVSGEPLQPTDVATTVRVRNDETVTSDGPFAETKEVLGGYYLVECKDLDRAIELAARIPGSHYGSVEVRPVQEFPAPVG